MEIKDYDLGHLYLGESYIVGAGKGVFTKINIEKDQNVEKARIVKIPAKNTDGTLLSDYVFCNPYNKRENIVVFGYGSMYNHSDNPNIHYYYDKDEKCMVYEAIRYIKAGEELYISYGNKWWKGRENEKK